MARPVIEERSYTAVITIEQDVAGLDTDEAWDSLLDYMQDHFNMQWMQTRGSGTGWTVTIHKEDRIDTQDPEDGVL